MINTTTLLIGIILALAISYAAYRAGSLSKSGMAGAMLLGSIVFGLGGLNWSVLLLGFFISSSGLSRLWKQRKLKFEEKFSKGSQRDIWQVAANGGISGVFVLLQLAFPGAVWPWFAFAGSLAAANADTWATELGVLSRKAPRSITTWKVVAPGTSGGISLAGSAAALAGSALIALLGAAAWPYAEGLSFSRLLLLLGAVTAGGFLGSLADSLLGATLQAVYTCPRCQKETERHPFHTCGEQTRRLRGMPWLNNDWVNTACTLVGALAALLLSLLR